MIFNDRELKEEIEKIGHYTRKHDRSIWGNGELFNLAAELNTLEMKLMKLANLLDLEWQEKYEEVKRKEGWVKAKKKLTSRQ